MRGITTEKKEDKMVIDKGDICEDCGQDMSSEETKTCTKPIIRINGISYSRVPFSWQPRRCPECGIELRDGNIHHLGCDEEICPTCGGQLNECGCLAHINKNYSVEERGEKWK